jgi:hypothetical protein
MLVSESLSHSNGTQRNRIDSTPPSLIARSVAPTVARFSYRLKEPIPSLATSDVPLIDSVFITAGLPQYAAVFKWYNNKDASLLFAEFMTRAKYDRDWPFTVLRNCTRHHRNLIEGAMELIFGTCTMHFPSVIHVA